MSKKTIPFTRYAWTVLGTNLLVIVWGAVVRATGSGAGCGNHWPLCDGEVIPPSPGVATLIEFSHRGTSGFALLMVVALTIWAFRAFPKGHAVRKSAIAAMAFMIVEALIGAALVILGLVEDNSSPMRAIIMAGHLANTFLLLAALTLTAHGSSLPIISQRAQEKYKTKGGDWRLWVTGIALLLSGISGAVSALGDTLFPSEDLRQAIQQDFSSTAHFLIRLRIFHPLIAIVAALFAFTVARRGLESPQRTVRTIRLCQLLMATVVTQLAGGVINVALSAPLWMQLVHLLLADIVWIVYILVADAQWSSGHGTIQSPTSTVRKI